MTIPHALAERRWRTVSLLVGCGALQAGAAVAAGYLVSVIFARILARPAAGTAAGGTAGPGTAFLVTVAGLLAACVIVLAWLRRTERVLAERVGQDYAHSVRMRLFDKVAESSPRVIARRSTGATALRFTGDLTALRNWVSLGLARLAVAGPLLLGLLAALAVLGPALGIAVGATLLLGFAATWWYGRGLRDAAYRARQRRSRLAGNVTEKVANVAVMAAFGQRERERRRLDREGRRLRRAMIDRGRASGRIRAVAELTAHGAMAAVLVSGAVAGLTPAAVAAAIAIVTFLVTPVRDLSRVHEYWQSARVSRAAIAAVLSRPTGRISRDHAELRHDHGQGNAGADSAAPPLEPGPGRLELDRVTVRGALHEVSAVAEPGQVIAVTGRSGAGKSTLLAVVADLLQPDTGAVLLDGQDVTGAEEESVRAAFGFMGPDLPLLRGSVARNVRYRCPDASPEELWRVRRITGLDEILAALPHGERTRVKEGGAGLSSGQRQRVALARAVLGGPRVLLLDEPDANLDAESARAVDRVIEEFAGTVLVVTHRAERLGHADVTWHLDAGHLRVVRAVAAD